MDKVSVLRMIDGAIEERVNYEVGKVIDNVLDLNTEPQKKRTIKITLEFVPDETRQILQLSAKVESKLVPTENVRGTLAIGAGNGGEVVVWEHGKQMPGQMDMTGGEQPQPKLLQFAK